MICVHNFLDLMVDVGANIFLIPGLGVEAWSLNFMRGEASQEEVKIKKTTVKNTPFGSLF